MRAFAVLVLFFAMPQMVYSDEVGGLGIISNAVIVHEEWGTLIYHPTSLLSDELVFIDVTRATDAEKDRYVSEFNAGVFAGMILMTPDPGTDGSACSDLSKCAKLVKRLCLLNEGENASETELKNGRCTGKCANGKRIGIVCA